MKNYTQRANRIIQKHATGVSLGDCIFSASISALIIILEICSLIRSILSPNTFLNGLPLSAAVFMHLICALACFITIRFAVSDFRKWRQTPEKVAPYKHLATAPVSELQAGIDQLKQESSAAKDKRAELYEEKDRLKKEFKAQLGEVKKKINAEQKLIDDAGYDSEIDLRKKLLKAQNKRSFFQRLSRTQ